MPPELAIVACASFLAGLVDSIVGGGGLILVPALFATFPGTAPATLLGTNKCASVWGTSFAAVQYVRRVDLSWRWLLPAASAALVGGFTGAWSITLLDPGFLRKLLPLLLLAVLVYTLLNRNLGLHHAPTLSPTRLLLTATAFGAVIGWYDGFFGPGTGSFFIFLFVRWLGFDFLHASAAAKVLNVATNLAALALFSMRGHVWWEVGLVMAAANVAGSLTGTRLALRHGAQLVRRVFIVVVSALILKTAYDAFVH
jgi:uncharacterized membrane protein YfcA